MPLMRGVNMSDYNEMRRKFKFGDDLVAEDIYSNFSNIYHNDMTFNQCRFGFSGDNSYADFVIYQSNLTSCIFKECYFRNPKFRKKTVFRNCTFIGCDFKDIELEDSIFENCYFIDCSMDFLKSGSGDGKLLKCHLQNTKLRLSFFDEYKIINDESYELVVQDVIYA